MKKKQTEKRMKKLPLFMRLFPNLWVKYKARKMGVNTNLIKLADDLFGRNGNKRLDFFPLKSSRGFKIVIDNKFCLWFFQEGDHFVYDGWGAGKHSKGDISIFDKLKN